MTKKIALAFFAIGVTVLTAHAATPNADAILQGLVDEIFNPLYRLSVGVSFTYFLYGVVRYMHDLRNPQDKNTGKQHLLWGTIGLFIIFSVGGIINTFGDMFGVLGS